MADTTSARWPAEWETQQMAFLGWPSRGDWYRDGELPHCPGAKHYFCMRGAEGSVLQCSLPGTCISGASVGLAGGKYAQQEIAHVAKVLSQYQPVTICTNPDQVACSCSPRALPLSTSSMLWSRTSTSAHFHLWLLYRRPACNEFWRARCASRDSRLTLSGAHAGF